MKVLFIIAVLVSVVYSESNILNLDNFNNTSNIERRERFVQECTTPTGAKGQCKNFQHCSLPNITDSIWKIFQYTCIFNGLSIGICCANDISERIGEVVFPEDGDELPVWETGLDLEEVILKPEERGCGLSTKQFPKVVGGRPADPGEWPWMAAVLRTGSTESYCGGVLITNQHVLTVAHCTHPYSNKELFVRLGEYDFRTYNETRARDFGVIDIREHIDYDPITYGNDISILKLHRTTMFTTYIWPVCMPSSLETFEGYMAIITGWGTQFYGGPNSNILMEVSVPIWEKDRCKEIFTDRIIDTVLCAGGAEGGRDSCQGDSGGPLLVQLPNRRWTVVGLVSWGMRCGEANQPGVYTRVSAYNDWIVENALF